jgi:ABC-2 type transport system permease protein
MIILTLVFSIFLKIEVENYPLFVFSGLLPWMFFSLSLQSGISSLIANRDLIKKVNFPRELLPMSSVFAHLFTFCLVLVLLTAFVVVTLGPSFLLLFLIPVIVLETILIISIVLLLSSLDIYYRDVSFVLQAMLTVWFYATPILYPIEFVPEKYFAFYILNPMVGITTSFQSIFLHTNVATFTPILISAVETAILLPIGFFVFKKRSKYFADWV